MKTNLLSATAGLAIIASSAFAEEVRVYNWSDYIDEELLTKFEAETGIDLIYDVFDSNEVLETKLLAGGSGYDVVVPSGTFLQRQIQAGAFQNRWRQAFQRRQHVGRNPSAYGSNDPGGEYSVNYMWGTTGIGYNIGKVEEALGADAPLDSWSLVLIQQTWKNWRIAAFTSLMPHLK